MKGAVQLSLVREIYTVTTETQRPRHFSLSSEDSGGFSRGAFGRSLEPGAGAWEEQRLEGSCHLPLRCSCQGHITLYPQRVAFLIKWGVLLIYEAHRVMVRFLFENQIMSYWE